MVAEERTAHIMYRGKYWIPALALVLALVLTGCRGTKPETGVVTPETTANPQTTESPETTANAENPFSLGRIEGGTYENSYAGLGCKLDDNWVFYSAEELQEMPAAVQEAMEGSELEQSMGNMEQIMDMKADNESALTTMNVLYTKMDVTTRLAYRLMSEEEIIDTTLAQKDMMIEAYTQAGILDADIQKVQVKFLGEDHFGLKTSAKVQGVDYYILQVFNYHMGAYGVTLSCGSFLEDNTQEMLDLFYPVTE